MRKKLDKDVDNTPAGSSSIWTARMQFVAEIYFLCGYLIGFCSLLMVIACIPMGVTVHFRLMLITVMVDSIIFWSMIKCFDWGHNIKSGEEQEAEEDDPFFV
jgi:hypothetical protein